MIIPLLAGAAIVLALWPKEEDENPGDKDDDNPEELTGTVKQLANRAERIKRALKRAKEKAAEAEDE